MSIDNNTQTVYAFLIGDIVSKYMKTATIDIDLDMIIQSKGNAVTEDFFCTWIC
ncbi:MAG: hypothetical protein ACPKPY_00370 [Nitrososphaeraceae archaeon]